MQSSSYSFIPPSSTCTPEDLLFFDTFSHSNSDKDNFDLVQFPSPVIIDLIKIVPLGQPIEANIPGNVRLGATNPSKCELEFFINDLTKQDAHTMTDLGRFMCSDKETDFAPPLQIQTDGLLLRGSYRTLTLAIFGQIVAFDEKPEEEQAIMSAASPPAQTPASPVASERDMPFIIRSPDEELIRRAQDEEVSIQESIPRSIEFAHEIPVLDGADHVTDDSMLDEPVEDSLRTRTNIEELSNSGDAATLAGFNDSRDKREEEVERSIANNAEASSRHSNRQNDASSRRSSDKHGSHEDNRQLKQEQQHQQPQQQNDDNSSDLDAQEWFFDAETYIPKALACFPDPSLTLQERTLQLNTALNDRQSSLENVEDEVKKVKEMFDVLGCSNETKTEDWVTLVEDLTNDIANMSLSRTVSNDEMLEFLVQQVMCGLDVESAISQKQTGYKVRHLKAGLKLATILFHSGAPAVKALLGAGVIQKVLLLYNQEQMSLPLRLLIFRCLSAVCDTVEGVEHMIEVKYQFDDGNLLIGQIKKRQNGSNSVEIDGCLEAIQSQELLTSYQYTILLLVSNPATRVKTAIGNLIKKIRLYADLSQISALATVATNDLNDDNVFEKDINHNEEAARLETILHLVQDVVCLIENGCSNITQPIRHLPAKVQFHIKPSPSDSYLALFKWLKYFKTIECLDSFLTCSRSNCPEIQKTIKLRVACLALIQLILDAPRGTQFLLSNDCHQQTASLVRNLGIKTAVSREVMESDCLLPNDSIGHIDETLSIACCRDMSLKMIYSFKVLSCIDKLFDFHREISAIRNSRDHSKTICDPEKVLHQLFILSDHPYGLAAIMKHFSCIGNLDCILRFLDMPESQKHLEFVRETAIDYVLELVGTFCRLNNNVLEIAEEYLDTLIDLCKIKDKTLSNRIKSLLPWLTPFEVDQPLPLITYSDETFKKLTRVIRKSIPDCSIPFAEGLNYQLPPQLITAVRILRQLCISPEVEAFISSNFDSLSSSRKLLQADQVRDTASTLPILCDTPLENGSKKLVDHGTQNLIGMQSKLLDDSPLDNLAQLNSLTKLYRPYDETICGDLKYHYAIMQLCEQEGLKRLLNTLRELIGNYPRPIYQSAALCGLRGRIVISYIHSVVVLLHSITSHLIDAREKEFRDTSIIGVMLETYSLLSFVPKPDIDKIEQLSKEAELSALQKSQTLKYDNYKLAQQAKKLILSILTSYTQICLSVSESEANVISKSMWTKMLKEVVDFTLSAPVFFQHGLNVLTRILPPPLVLTNYSATASVTAADNQVHVDQEQLPSPLTSVNLRKLWSAHLHPLHQKIESMISNLSLCHSSAIRIQLYYLCHQLCDLSSNAACMVAKAVTDTLLTCAAKFNIDSSSDHSHSTIAVDAQQQSTVGDTNGQQSLKSEDRTAAAVAGSIHTIITGTAGSKFALKMVVNLAAHLIENQAFETAFTNSLQVLSKKDQDKSLHNLYGVIKSQEDFKLSESCGVAAVQVESGSSVHTSSASLVTNLIEFIKSVAASAPSDSTNTVDLIANLTPPEELTKINLIEMARKTSDKFNLTTGITRTYRLKVLIDMKSRAHRSSESASGASKRFERPTLSGHHQELLVQSSQKSAYPPPPIRGRPRASVRPDSFRSRPQNTSRPPSIHVDDFNDMYGADAGAQNPGRYGGGGRKEDYRMSPAARYQELAHGRLGSPMSGQMHSSGRHHYYNSPQPLLAHPPPPPQPSGSHGGAGAGGSRRSNIISEMIAPLALMLHHRVTELQLGIDSSSGAS